MLQRTRLAVSLVVTSALFFSATAEALTSLVPSLVVTAKRVLQGPPPDFSETPGTVHTGTTPSTDPLNRNGVWNTQLLTQLAAMQTDERSKGAGGSSGTSTGAGEGFSWEGNAPGGTSGTVNTNTGNRLTSIPIVAWNCVGDLGVNLTMYHNSQGIGGPRLGNKWRTSFDFQVFHNNNLIVGSKRVAIVRWPDGTYVPYIETGNGTNQYQTEGGGVYDKLVRSPVGETASWMLVTKDQTRYLFDGIGRLVGIKDRKGNLLNINRAFPDQISVVDSSGRALILTYANTGLLQSVKDPLNRIWTFSYDGAKNLIGITYPPVNGQTYTRTFGYDARFNITSETDLRGKTWACVYDGSDRLTSWSTPTPLNETVTFTYGGSQTSYTLPVSGSVKHNYSNGQLVSEVDPAGFSTAYGYNTVRNVTTSKDKRGNTWSYGYDANGNVLKVWDPLTPVSGTATHEYTYTATNDVLVDTNRLGRRMEYVYDSWGKVLRIEYRIGATIGNVTVLETNTYDSYGQLATSAPLGLQQKTLAYNTQGDLTSASLIGGATREVDYDTLGRVTSMRNVPDGAVTYALDNWGRIATLTNPDSSTATVTYDPEGNVTNAVDENNHGTVFTYDEAGRLKTKQNGRGDIESYGYNASGWLTSVTNGRGKTRTYGYTIRGDQKNVTLPDGYFENSTFDANGNVAQYEDRRLANSAQKVIYTYNALDALTKVDYPTTTDTAYTYDNLQRISTMTDATGMTTWTYDATGYEWLASINTPSGSVGYTYNAGWRRATMNDGSGATTYGYTGGRLTSITNAQNETTSWSYDSYGRVQRQTLASGAYTTYGYDNRGRVNAISHMKSNSTSISLESYIYDPVGNLSSKNVGGVTTTYTYDNADQLLTESRPGYSASYAYDGNGNRLSKTLNAVVEAYTYDDGDKLLTAGTKTYSYDLAGRTSQVISPAGTTTVGYDDENRVTSVSGPGVSQSYQYNGFNTRMKKNGFSFKRDGAYPASPVLADGQATYTPGISERRGGVTRFMHQDYLGTNKIQTDPSQSITDTRQYDAYGLQTGSTGSSPTPFGFAGGHGYQTDETGLMLLGLRYYDSSTGRFLTRDPAAKGRNWYGYCDNNPLKYIDPNGLDRVVIIVGEGNANEERIPDRFEELVDLWSEYLKKKGHEVIILYGPTKEEADLSNADHLIFIGHGVQTGFNVQQGRRGGIWLLNPRVLGELLKGNKLKTLISYACSACQDKETGDEFAKYADRFFGFNNISSHVHDMINNWDDWKKGRPIAFGKLPRRWIPRNGKRSGFGANLTPNVIKGKKS